MPPIRYGRRSFSAKRRSFKTSTFKRRGSYTTKSRRFGRRSYVKKRRVGTMARITRGGSYKHKIKVGHADQRRVKYVLDSIDHIHWNVTSNTAAPTTYLYTFQLDTPVATNDDPSGAYPGAGGFVGWTNGGFAYPSDPHWLRGAYKKYKISSVKLEMDFFMPNQMAGSTAVTTELNRGPGLVEMHIAPFSHTNAGSVSDIKSVAMLRQQPGYSYHRVNRADSRGGHYKISRFFNIFKDSGTPGASVIQSFSGDLSSTSGYPVSDPATQLVWRFLMQFTDETYPTSDAHTWAIPMRLKMTYYLLFYDRHILTDPAVTNPSGYVPADAMPGCPPPPIFEEEDEKRVLTEEEQDMKSEEELFTKAKALSIGDTFGTTRLFVSWLRFRGWWRCRRYIFIVDFNTQCCCIPFELAVVITLVDLFIPFFPRLVHVQFHLLPLQFNMDTDIHHACFRPGNQ